jgi:hypothetical protein
MKDTMHGRLMPKIVKFTCTSPSNNHVNQITVGFTLGQVPNPSPGDALSHEFETRDSS